MSGGVFLEKIVSVEIVSKNQRFVADTDIVKYYPSSKVLYTNIPRGSDGSPIPLSPTDTYNLVFTSSDSILFFKAVFNFVTLLDDRPCYLFNVSTHRYVPNLRKENRKSVNFQAVAADFNAATVVTILDISEIGARIMSHQKLISEFIELFFDQSNDQKSIIAAIKWENFNSDKEAYFYGVDFRKR